MHNWQRVTLAVVAFDQCTKIAANYWLNQFTAKVIIPDFLYFSLSYSNEAVFNYFSTNGSRKIWILLLVSLLAIALIFYAKKSLKPHQTTSAFALSVILGGAIGNLIDRLYMGKNIDFISLHFSNRLHWPTFNVADAAIMLGVAILIADGLYGGNDKTHKD